MIDEDRIIYNQPNENRRWPLWWVVFPVLLILSICASGYLYYKYYKSTHAVDGKSYETINKENVEKYNIEKAELNRQLDELNAQLQIAIQGKDAEIAGLKDELDARKLQIAKKIKTASPGNPKALREAKEEIERLKSLQSIFESKNESLSAENREYVAKILDLENTTVEAQTKARDIEQEKNVLSEKIKSSALTVADLKVAGMREKGSTDEETFKAFKTDKLKITFTILSNDLIPTGPKEIIVRLIGTNGEVLTNDNNTLADTDKLASMVQTVDFQNDPIKTIIYFSQKPTYKKGTYSVELIHNDKLMGRASFILR